MLASQAPHGDTVLLSFPLWLFSSGCKSRILPSKYNHTLSQTKMNKNSFLVSLNM
jgi:hypothetical protein